VVFGFNRAIVLMNNFIGNRQAKPGALPYFFGGKKGFKNVGQILFLHPGAVIDDGYGLMAIAFPRFEPQSDPYHRWLRRH
jgi:hypothetical protein